jgi:serine/threonine protein kinase
VEPLHEPNGEGPNEVAQTGGFGPRPFGRYYLLDRVAVGGMAEVFLAKTFGHAGFEKVLVVKRIREQFADDPAFVAMFVDEAKLSAQLVHPNVVQLHDFGKHGKHWFLAMEAVHGKDLKSVMRRLAERGERMPIELAAVIAHEIARGLQYAHTRTGPAGEPLNIVHRDMSPSNVLISYEGHVKIVDFGIAKAETTRDESAEAHLLKGKFQYMSPEQTLRHELDHRSDVFAAGICLWEMLTGHRLFKREADHEVIQAIRAGHVPPPSEYNPDVPSALDRICLKALQVRLADRYADAGAMQRELQDFLLPATPERLQPSMQALLAELFAQEIVDARAQLEEATRLAADIHYGTDDLELGDELTPAVVPAPGTHPDGSGTLTPPVAPRRGPGMGLFAALLMIPLLLVGGWALTRTAAPPALASLSVAVSPADLPGLTITLDGAPFTSPSDRIEPGVPHEPIARRPDPTPATAEPSTPEVAVDTPVDVAGPPTLAFRSEPEGAKVFVDGRPIGTTPLNWENGVAGTEYNVEFRMSGYSSVQAVVAAPARGERRRLTRTLAPKEVVSENTDPGRLSVQVSSGWARIYVDEAYVDTTPLFEHSIAPGTYTIRVVNERTGLDVREKVTVRAGEVSRKTFRVDE